MNKEIRIRRFQKSDAKILAKLIKENLLKVNTKNYPQQEMKSLSTHYDEKRLVELAKKRDIYVAVQNQKIIGTVSLDENYVLGVFVDMSKHGKGIGRQLMEFIENIAKKNGRRKLKLPSSYTAENFYRKLGYKKLPKSKQTIKGNTLMEKWI